MIEFTSKDGLRRFVEASGLDIPMEIKPTTKGWKVHVTGIKVLRRPGYNYIFNTTREGRELVESARELDRLLQGTNASL